MNCSLSGDTKDSLANDLPTQPESRLHLGAAMFLYGQNRLGLFSTRRLSIARALHRLISNTGIRKDPGHSSFLVQLKGELPPLPPLDHLIRGRAKRRLELRGAFLACASLSVSKRGGYHLEFVLHDTEQAERLLVLLQAETLDAKMLIRREHPVVYFKDAELIVSFLSAVGAFGAVMQLEDMRAVKDTKNRIRRIVNTEAANLDRTIDAASSARDLIEALIAARGLGSLSPALREAATLRLAHPMASLSELGGYCSPPIGKSTLSGRLAALRKLAEGL